MKFIFFSFLVSTLLCVTVYPMYNPGINKKITIQKSNTRKSKYDLRCCPYCLERFTNGMGFKSHISGHDEVKRLEDKIAGQILPRMRIHSTPEEIENKMKALAQAITQDLKQAH